MLRDHRAGPRAGACVRAEAQIARMQRLWTSIKNGYLRLIGPAADWCVARGVSRTTITTMVTDRVIFGGGPYGHMLSGTPKSVGRISRAQLAKLHGTYFRPDNAVRVFVGSVTAEQGFAWAEKFFGDWKKPAAALPVKPVAGGPG